MQVDPNAALCLSPKSAYILDSMEQLLTPLGLVNKGPVCAIDGPLGTRPVDCPRSTQGAAIGSTF